jgi:hypothetical protein
MPGVCSTAPPRVCPGSPSIATGPLTLVQLFRAAANRSRSTRSWRRCVRAAMRPRRSSSSIDGLGRRGSRSWATTPSGEFPVHERACRRSCGPGTRARIPGSSSICAQDDGRCARSRPRGACSTSSPTPAPPASAAALAGAREVWNVRFLRRLAPHRRAPRGAERRGRSLSLPSRGLLAVLRQLAGLPVQRRGKGPAFTKLAPQTFDLVVLDPPRLATGPFGKVDLVRRLPIAVQARVARDRRRRRVARDEQRRGGGARSLARPAASLRREGGPTDRDAGVDRARCGLPDAGRQGAAQDRAVSAVTPSAVTPSALALAGGWDRSPSSNLPSIRRRPSRMVSGWGGHPRDEEVDRHDAGAAPPCCSPWLA